MKSIVSLVAALVLLATIVPGAFAQAPAAPPAVSPSTAAPASATSAAPTTTPAAPIALPEQPAQETVDNPYSLTALWQGGDLIARGTIIILLIMSLGSWYVMITKFVEQALLLRQGREAHRNFWKAASIRSGADSLGGTSAYRAVVEDGLGAAEHHEGKLTEQIDRHTWITMSLQRAVDAIGNRLQGGLAVLATVGSTAPFVGLFGTVWGIYHALTAIGIAGQASIDKVAGPVGEALIMTAIGLAVAVPAVLGYNWMVRRNKVAMDQVRGFSGDLLALLVAGTTAAPKPAVRSA
ncbi:MAG TPA: MotA/TolQ/ExbB proton channel family protein [Stellaceae bacterium]|jgi:biopolymer transport protein ExbB